jgi:hypothetical protein
MQILGASNAELRDRVAAYKQNLASESRAKNDLV